MKIELEKYIIETDPLNYTLYKKTKTKNKETGETKQGIALVGYYANLRQAVKAILGLKIKTSEKVELNTVYTWLNEMGDYIDDVVDELDKEVSRHVENQRKEIRLENDGE